MTFEFINGGFVVSIYNAGGAEGTECLGKHVDWELGPGETAVDTHA